MKKVLLVEDDRDFAYQCVKTLLDNHFEVSYCENAEKAKLEILSSEFDIIIIDLMLPPTFGVEGLELFKYISNHINDYRVVFITAKDRGTTEIVAEAMKLGALNFLDKHNPLFFDKLLVTLKEISTRQIKLNLSEVEAVSECSTLCFISYSRKNTDLVERLVQDLKKRNIPTWRDVDNIPAGAKWDREIEKAIKSCTHILLLATQESVDSENVRNEIDLALAYKKIVFPLFFEECELPLCIRRSQRIDFRSNYIQALDELRKLLGV